MKVRELTSIIRVNKRVEIRDEDGYEICVTNADSKGIEPYLEREITQWFPNCSIVDKADFVIYLKEAADGTC